MSIVIGTVIGSGVFLVPSTMIRSTGSVPRLFLIWVIAGLLSLFGALTYAELAAAMPEAGGEYVYLRAAYSPFWGFLYGWAQFWVGKSGSIATLAAGFYVYLTAFIPVLSTPDCVLPWHIGHSLWPVGSDCTHRLAVRGELCRRPLGRQSSGVHYGGQDAVDCRHHYRGSRGRTRFRPGESGAFWRISEHKDGNCRFLCGYGQRPMGLRRVE